VLLRVVVGQDGTVRKAAVEEVEPSGQGFEEAALEAVRSSSCQFDPATYKGRPVQMQLELPLSFKLS
jgi:TonB family protein